MITGTMAQLREAAAQKPAGYLEAVLAAATVENETVTIPGEALDAIRARFNPALEPPPRSRKPVKIARTVIINLPRRADRRARLEQHLHEHGQPFGPVSWHAASDGSRMRKPPGWRDTRGALGCLASHRAVLEKAMRDGLDNVLVLEDDVFLFHNAAAGLADFLAAAPADWQMLMLGGHGMRGAATGPAGAGRSIVIGVVGVTVPTSSQVVPIAAARSTTSCRISAGVRSAAP